MLEKSKTTKTLKNNPDNLKIQAGNFLNLTKIYRSSEISNCSEVVKNYLNIIELFSSLCFFYHVKKMAEADISLEDETGTEHKQSPLAQKTTPETGERLKKN